jgi:glycosyltransferase involved in cell wall biosynthesis
MRLAFIDLGSLDYCARTPLERPLGGTESALVYLCAELVALGHEVRVFNQTSTPGTFHGVEYLNRTRDGALAAVNDCDAAIVIGVADGLSLRAANVEIPLVLWTGHLDNFPLVQALANRQELDVWTSFAFVSDWQRNRFVQRFGIDPATTAILRNAVAPTFARQALVDPWFQTGSPPTLVYTSTPFRGLVIALHAFAKIRTAFPGARFRVFSGMATYQATDQDAAFAKIYDLARSMPGVDYVGPVSQTVLATELAGASALAYPSIYPETSCIAAMEAMSCGATVLTTRLGALPETVGEYGSFVDMAKDATTLVASFAEMAIDALRRIEVDPDNAAERRSAQLADVRARCVWSARAREWERWLVGMVNR